MMRLDMVGDGGHDHLPPGEAQAAQRMRFKLEPTTPLPAT